MSRPFDRISAREAAQRWSNGSSLVVLLDCREPEEVAIARIPGAVHVPMGDIPGRLPHLDPDLETIVFCHHGVRSLSVASFLAANGFAHVSSLSGGIDAWSTDVDPGVPRY